MPQAFCAPRYHGTHHNMLVAVAMLCLLAVACGGSGLVPASLATDPSGATSNDAPGTSGMISPLPPPLLPCLLDESGLVDCTSRGLTRIPRNLPQNATSLDFTNNSLTSLPAAVFSRFTRLEVLNLSRNDISVVNESAFQGLGHLRVLNLSGNSINVTGLRGNTFSPLSGLQVLNLQGNFKKGQAILDYPDASLAALRSLRHLFLDAWGEMRFGSGFTQLRNLSSLWFSGRWGSCKVPTLYNHTFINVWQIRLLTVYYCNVSHIEPLAFQPLRRIDILNLSNNRYLGFKGMAVASFGLQHSSLRVLKLESVHRKYATCVRVMACHLHFLRNTSLEELHIDGNNIKTIEKGAAALVPRSLKVVSARYNQFTYGAYIHELAKLPSLTLLDLSYTNTYHFFPDLSERKWENLTCEDPCPSFWHIHDSCRQDIPRRNLWKETDPDLASSSDDERSFPLSLPPNIKSMDFTWNLMYYDMSEMNISANCLENLDLSYNVLMKLKGPIFGLEKLKKLNLSHNLASLIEVDFFHTFSSLESLDLTNNDLPNLLNETEGEKRFGQLKHLKVLNVSKNKIGVISKTALYGLDSLEVFNAHGNFLTVKDLLLDIRHLRKLKALDLSKNYLNYLPQELCDAVDALASLSNTSLQLDLSRNPLVCSCGEENVRFLRWITITKANITNQKDFFCLFANGTTGPFWESLEAVEATCNNYLALTLSCFASVCSYMGVIVGFLAYRNRWKLHYLFYAAWGTGRRVGARSPSDFEFDAFVSNDEHDDAFAREVAARLERQGLTVRCSHDFAPGRFLTSSIVDAVQSSRRTLCILSRNFFDNYFCHYALQMAIQEGLHMRRKTVLVVFYDPVQARALPREVLRFVQAGDYVEYPLDARCIPFFWDRLAQALDRPQPSRSRVLSA